MASSAQLNVGLVLLQFPSQEESVSLVIPAKHTLEEFSECNKCFLTLGVSDIVMRQTLIQNKDAVHVLQRTERILRISCGSSVTDKER